MPFPDADGSGHRAGDCRSVLKIDAAGDEEVLRQFGRDGGKIQAGSLRHGTLFLLDEADLFEADGGGTFK